MKSYRRLLLLPVIILSALPARALIMVSEARSVFVSYYGAGIETHSSPGTFGQWTGSAIGTPFGGGNVAAYQQSNITSTGFDLHHAIYDGYGPGGRADSNFQFVFRLTQPTPISITGFSFYFSGPASLVSDTLGNIPLVWGPDGSFYRNYLDFSRVLNPGLYTFTSNEWMRGDGINTRISLRDDLRDDPPNPISDVPDSGSTAGMLGLALVALVAIRRR